MAQAASYTPWFFWGEAGFRSQIDPCGICGGQGGNGTFFSKYIGFYPCHYYSDNASYTLTFRHRASSL